MLASNTPPPQHDDDTDPAPPRRAALAWALVLGVVGLTTAYATRGSGWADAALHALEWAQTLGPGVGSAAVVGLYVVCALAMLPAAPLSLLAGFVLGPVWGTVAVSLGSTLGATAAFAAGRTALRPWLRARLARWPRVQALERAVVDQGFRMVLLTRLSPIFPYNVLNYAYGLTGVDMRRYVLATWLGMLPGTALYVGLGAAANDVTQAMLAPQEAPSVERWVMLSVGVLAAGVAAALFARRARVELARLTPTLPTS